MFLNPINGNGLPSTERGSSIPIGMGEAAPPFEDEGGVSINPLNSGDPLMAPTTASAIYKITKKQIQWNLVIKRSDITKPSYNKVILLVPALYIS